MELELGDLDRGGVAPADPLDAPHLPGLRVEARRDPGLVHRIGQIRRGHAPRAT